MPFFVCCRFRWLGHMVVIDGCCFVDINITYIGNYSIRCFYHRIFVCYTTMPSRLHNIVAVAAVFLHAANVVGLHWKCFRIYFEENVKVNLYFLDWIFQGEFIFVYVSLDGRKQASLFIGIYFYINIWNTGSKKKKNIKLK